MNHAVPNSEPLIYERFHLASARFRLADHDVDVMFFKPLQPLGELRRSEVEQFTVDPCPAVSQPSRAGDHFLVETFAPAHDGAQDHHLFTAIGTTDAVENLTATEGANLPAALNAVLFSDFGVKEPQVVIDLLHGCNGRFLTPLAAPLLDGDRRRYAGEQIDVGLRHDLKKLPCVRGKAIDVTPLTFRVDDVESQRGFSRAAQAGDDHETVSRDVKADVLKVVLLGADNSNGIIFPCTLEGLNL